MSLPIPLTLNTPRARARLHRALSREPGLSDYLATLAPYPPLDAAEEYTLATAARLGDVSARERLIACNLRLVVSIAACYAERGVSLLDLISVGNGGLIKAVDRYDPARARLSTHATWWIRAACNHAVLAYERGTHGSVQAPLSLDRAMTRRRQTARDGETVTLVDVLPQTHGPTVEERAEDADAHATLWRKLATDLTERERTVLALHFAEDRTYRQIGATLGISSERVRQIAEAALAKLRASYAADARPDLPRQPSLWQTTPAS